jgi:hypothetical protein
VRRWYGLPVLSEFCGRLAMDFTALFNFCNSSRINRNSLAMSWAISSFILHPVFLLSVNLQAPRLFWRIQSEIVRH